MGYASYEVAVDEAVARAKEKKGHYGVWAVRRGGHDAYEICNLNDSARWDRLSRMVVDKEAEQLADVDAEDWPAVPVEIRRPGERSVFASIKSIEAVLRNNEWVVRARLSDGRERFKGVGARYTKQQAQAAASAPGSPRAGQREPALDFDREPNMSNGGTTEGMPTCWSVTEPPILDHERLGVSAPLAPLG